MLSRRLAAALCVTLTAVGGCQMPRFQGPQIQSPPENFLLNPNNRPGAWMFGDREQSFSTAWVHTDMSGTSLIRIVGHPGTTTLEEVMAAREAVIAAGTDPDLIADDIEALTIDDRRAWGWYERVQSERRGLVQVAYRAVVPYDTVTYAIEFFSGEPSLKGPAPDTLRAIVTSFAVGRTTLDFPRIAILAGGVLLLVAFLRGRARERHNQLRNINLVKVARPDEEKGDGEAGDPDDDAPVEVGAGAVGAAPAARPAGAGSGGVPVPGAARPPGPAGAAPRASRPGEPPGR